MKLSYFVVWDQDTKQYVGLNDTRVDNLGLARGYARKPRNIKAPLGIVRVDVTTENLCEEG